MTEVTPEQALADSAEVLTALQEAVRGLRKEIEGLTEQARSGGEIAETSAKRQLGQIQGLVAHCAKAENILNECRNRQAGVVSGGYAVDLDKARADIGCKLDRLRRCGGSGPVSQ